MRDESWAAVVFLFGGAARGLPKSFRPGAKKESACATANSRRRGNLISHLRRRVNEINSNRFRQFNVNVGYGRPFYKFGIVIAQKCLAWTRKHLLVEVFDLSKRQQGPITLELEGVTMDSCKRGDTQGLKAKFRSAGQINPPRLGDKAKYHDKFCQ